MYDTALEERKEQIPAIEESGKDSEAANLEK